MFITPWACKITEYIFLLKKTGLFGIPSRDRAGSGLKK
jgi:hypothetical protein